MVLYEKTSYLFQRIYATKSITINIQAYYWSFNELEILPDRANSTTESWRVRREVGLCGGRAAARNERQRRVDRWTWALEQPSNKLVSLLCHQFLISHYGYEWCISRGKLLPTFVKPRASLADYYRLYCHTCVYSAESPTRYPLLMWSDWNILWHQLHHRLHSLSCTCSWLCSRCTHQ